MIESIGSTPSQAVSTAENQRISQEEFIKLFLAQLNYQDPLEPVNNREFLAQLAQFSSLEQARLQNEKLDGLLTMNASDQALSLLGQEVTVNTNANQSVVGTVEAVHYKQSGASLTIKTTSGTFLDEISLSQISVVNNTN